MINAYPGDLVFPRETGEIGPSALRTKHGLSERERALEEHVHYVTECEVRN